MADHPDIFGGYFYPLTQREILLDSMNSQYTNASGISNNNSLGVFIPSGEITEDVTNNPRKLPASILPPVVVYRSNVLKFTRPTVIGSDQGYNIIKDGTADITFTLTLEFNSVGEIARILIGDQQIMVSDTYNSTATYRKVQRLFYYTYFQLGFGTATGTVIPCMLLLSSDNKYSILSIKRKEDGNLFLGYKLGEWSEQYASPWYKSIQLTYAVQCTISETEHYCNMRYSIPDPQGIVDQNNLTEMVVRNVSDILTFSTSR